MAIQFIDLKAQYRRLQDKIQARINTVLEHGQFIMGPEIAELEEKLAKYVGVKHAITVSSGTDALLIPLMAMNIGPGDEVITPDFSFYATAEVVSLLGATPVFVDVDPKTCNLDTKQLKGKITTKTKAIIPVSLYGQCADMDTINQIAGSIPVIEDACQSFGATYKGKKSCSLSTVGATSFFPSKPLGCYGDGGAIFTNDDALAKKMKSIRTHGQEGRYNHPNLGINGRMDTLQAAIMIPKLEVFEEELELRQVVAKRYIDALKTKYQTPHIESQNMSAWAQFTLQVDNREAFVKSLNDKGIPTAVHYPKPLSKQPYYVERGFVADCPISDKLSQRVVSLPMHPYMSEEEQTEILSVLLNL